MQKDQFTRAMMELGLLETKPGEETDGFGTESSVNYAEYNNSKVSFEHHYFMPNFILTIFITD
jgi:hypothetical protein